MTLAIALSASAAEIPASDDVRAVRVPMDIVNRFPVLTVRINGVDVRLALDMGSGTTLTLYPEILHELGVNPTGEVVESIGMEGVVMKSPIHVVSRAELGGAVYEELEIRQDDHTPEHRANTIEYRGTYGRIGRGLFEHGKLVIDYQNESLTIIPANAPQTEQAACRGIELPLVAEKESLGLVTRVQTDIGEIYSVWDTGAPGNIMVKHTTDTAGLGLEARDKFETEEFIINGHDFGPVQMNVWDVPLPPDLNSLLGYWFFADKVVCVDFPRNSIFVRDDDALEDDAEKWRNYAHGLLRDSVAYRTVAGEGQVIPFAGFLADQFLQQGFDEGDVHLLPVQSEDESVATLVVRYKGRSADRPIFFVAHTDVVPAVASAWSTDPFELEEKDGFFYGRGVIDDKFGTTALTTAFLRLKSQGFVPENDLIVALTGDEETNMSSITTLVKEHFDLIDADVAFVVDSGHGLSNAADEPIAAFVQLAEKTYATYVIIARNRGGHSSKPRRDNAIYDIADATNAIRNYEFPVRYDAASRDYFAKMGAIVGGELGDAMRRFAEKPEDEDAIRVLSDDPEYVGKLRTTCVPTMVQGGHVENALPEEVELKLNCRLYPGVSADEVDARLIEVIANPDIEVHRESQAALVGPSPLRADVTALLEGVVSQLHPGVPVIPLMSPGMTDGKYLRAAGIDAYGATGLFLREGADRSHMSDERLSVRSFYDGLEFWYLLMKNASAHQQSQ